MRLYRPVGQAEYDLIYVGVSWYNSVQWCAMFVSWCAFNAGISESIVDYDQYTETQVQHFKNQGHLGYVYRGYSPLFQSD